MLEELGGEIKACSNKLYLMRSVYSCWHFDANETFASSNIYCLKAVKGVGDIDLKTILPDDQFERVKKTSNIDNNSALLIMADLDGEDQVAQFEETLNGRSDLYTVHSLQKYKEMIKEEDDKKKKK
jgi:hypothetical protein